MVQGRVMPKIRLSICLLIASTFILSSPLLAHAPPPDTTPPSIGTPTITPSTPGPDDPVTVLVNVTDNRSGVRNVTIVYTTDNWQSVNSTLAATYNMTTTTAAGQIPALTSGHVAYYIVAFDNAGNKRVSNNSGAFYTYDVTASPLTSVTNAWLAIVAVAGVALGVSIVSVRMLRKKPLTSRSSD